MLFWIADPSAAPPDPCLPRTTSGFAAQLYCLPLLVLQAAAVRISPAVAKNRRKLPTAPAAIPLKSP